MLKENKKFKGKNGKKLENGSQRVPFITVRIKTTSVLARKDDSR